MQDYNWRVLTNTPQSTLVGARLKAARERAGLTQQQLAAALGMEHRQSLTSVEAGERRLSPEELVRAVEVLGVDLDYFTDAFRLVGEGRFSFRARPGVAAHVLDDFEDRAGRWIATYRELGAQEGAVPDFLETKLALTRQSTFEAAQAAGESVAARWQLGDVPAERLQAAMEHHLRALVLHVDAPAGISGAASQVTGLNTVLVNRQEPEGRRRYNLAHELFHLLTWDVMPPARVEAPEVARGGKGHRVEQLAENFAAALLMPGDALRARWAARDAAVDLHDWIRVTASELRVSGVACKWRLHALGCLSRADLLDLNDQRLTGASRSAPDAAPVRRFSEPFVRRVAAALDAGRLSVRRAASLLALSLAGLAEVLREYGVEPEFEA
jgi:Zn-dependent peptidase ImmA (M78 family)/transcriptional regulator with XRE-family HTH domain